MTRPAMEGYEQVVADLQEAAEWLRGQVHGRAMWAAESINEAIRLIESIV